MTIDEPFHTVLKRCYISSSPLFYFFSNVVIMDRHMWESHRTQPISFPYIHVKFMTSSPKFRYVIVLTRIWNLWNHLGAGDWEWEGEVELKSLKFMHYSETEIHKF